MELGFLNPLYQRPGPWASVYFDTSFATEDAATRQELAARDTAGQLTEQGADERTAQAVYETLSELPRDGLPGRAVFATDGETVLTSPLALTPPAGSQTLWAALPHVSPLLELSDGHPSCLVAFLDRVGADFETRGPQGVRAEGTVNGEDWPITRTPSTDWSEQHFQQSVENIWEENASVIVEGLTERWRRSGAELLVLAGEARERRAVYDRLPLKLREVTVESEHGGRAPGSASKRLTEDINAACSDHARRHVEDIIDRFQAGRVPSGSGLAEAVEGVPALLEAAREHRMATLLVRPDGTEPHREVWVGQEPDQVATRRSDVSYLGGTHPVAARADDALLRSAAVTDAEVVTVPAAAELPPEIPVGGLGALLRWPYDMNTEGERHAAGQ